MRVRKKFVVASTASWVTTEVSLPKKIMIKRVRVVAASAANVALSFREVDSDSDVTDIPLEYALTASPIDSEEDIYAEAHGTDAVRGTFYVAVKSSASLNVTVLIEYEPAS